MDDIGLAVIGLGASEVAFHKGWIEKETRNIFLGLAIFWFTLEIFE